MTDINRMLFNLIIGIQDWNKSDFKGVPDKFTRGLHKFIFLAAQSNSNPPLDIPEMIQLIQRPASEWGIKGIEESFPSESSLIDPSNGLTIEAEEFLKELDNPKEYEQSKMKDILLYCREHNLDDKYCKIRTFLSDPKNAVIPYEQLLMFQMNIYHDEVKEMFNQCYEEVKNLSRFRKCPYCKWTLSWNGETWQCSKGSACYQLVDLSKAEKFPDNEKRYYRMIRGIQRYTLLPGIAEHRIEKNLLNKGYSVQMYPGIDQFDLLVENNKEKLALDVKDHSTPFYLAKHINKAILKKAFDHDIWFVIPDYRLDLFPAYIEMAKKRIEYLQIKLISERQLYQKVGEIFL